MMILPIHIVKMLLSNGVIFANENGTSQDMAKRIASKCHMLLETLVKDNIQYRDKKPS